MAAAAIWNCYFVTLDPPRSLLHGPNIVLKFDVNRLTTFSDMAIWTISKFCLKCLFPPPKCTFLGNFDPRTLPFVIESPKRHILGWIRVVWGIHRENPSTRFRCRRRQEKKGRKGKVHKVTSRLYFTNMGSRPPWTDFHKNWQVCRGPWR